MGRVEIGQYSPAVSSAVLRGANSLPRGPEKAKEWNTDSGLRLVFRLYIPLGVRGS